jgi:predicted O-linked N-acetylglucosamine transferase (SPINDLY family)
MTVGLNTSELFRAAVELHQAGRVGEAEPIYRQVLASEPEHADALHLLGLISQQTGRAAEAAQLIGRAAGLRPQNVQYLTNLGIALAALGNWEQAISAYQNALSLRPVAETYFNLGNALRSTGQRDEAIAAYRGSVKLRDNFVEAWGNLAAALHENRQLPDAIDAYERAARLRPDLFQAWAGLGQALREKGDHAAAANAYGKAVELRPDSAEASFSFGEMLFKAGEYDRAIMALRRTLDVRPDWLAPLSPLGAALHFIGENEQALRCHEKLLAGATDAQLAASLLHSLYYDASLDPPKILEQHRLWNNRHARQFAPRQPRFVNDGDPDRRIRVGYLSPDFCQHVSSFFTVPLLSNQDHRAFEVICYADVKRKDELTDLHRRFADVWRDVANLDDPQIAQLVQQDQIDILVDLSLHASGNRLLVFARKPAPLQITWLGCPGTSGLDTIDYRITDVYLDPDPADDRWYSEKTIRLPRCFWCYDPLSDQPDVNELPALRNGFVTFGSLNAISKATPQTLEMWADILRAVPNSRLLLRAPQGAARTRVIDLLGHRGVEASRVQFADRQPWIGYIKTFHRIDIGLDPFPYGGGTTSFDTLWMGVPLVSRTGTTPISRAGLSILSNLGNRQWVACDVGNYVRIATELASNLPRLAELRATMRSRMRISPLMDAAGFARDFEAILRRIWVAWCRTQA